MNEVKHLQSKASDLSKKAQLVSSISVAEQRLEPLDGVTGSNANLTSGSVAAIGFVFTDDEPVSTFSRQLC